jgi:hypothetical protein
MAWSLSTHEGLRSPAAYTGTRTDADVPPSASAQPEATGWMDTTPMNTALIVALVVLGVAALLLIYYIRGLLRKSRELEKHVDYSKMRKWEDDDDDR